MDTMLYEECGHENPELKKQIMTVQDLDTMTKNIVYADTKTQIDVHVDTKTQNDVHDTVQWPFF